MNDFFFQCMYKNIYCTVRSVVQYERQDKTMRAQDVGEGGVTSLMCEGATWRQIIGSRKNPSHCHAEPSQRQAGRRQDRASR